MIQNPMQLFQMFAQLRNNPNPFQMAQSMFGQNPLFSQAVKMSRGTTIDQKKQIIMNVAKEKNISPEELTNWASNFGINL